MPRLRDSQCRCGIRGLLAALLLLPGLATSAGASLIGDEVRIQISVLDTTFPVAAGVDPDFSYSSFNWNVEASSVDFWVANLLPGAELAAGVTFTLSDLDFTPPAVVTGASITDADGLFAGAMDDILTVGADSLLVDLSSFAGGSLAGAPSIEIELTTAVPEPRGAALLATGALVLAGAARRRLRPRA